MNYVDFAQKVRDKYPGAYDSVDDRTLAEKVVEKYPEYESQVEFDAPKSEAPGALKSAALGAMSGIPGAETVVSGVQALSPKTTYEEAHQNLENLKDQAWAEHPVAYGTGKTAGMVGTAMVAPASIPGAIGVGALSGLDAASKLEDIPKDVAIGAGTGGVFGAASKYIAEPAVNAVVNKVAPAIGKRAVASLGKPTLEDVQSYLNDPEAIRNYLTSSQQAEKLANMTQDIGQVSSQLSSQARSLLSSENAPLSIMDIKPVMQGAMERYLTNGVPATAADELAVKAIQNQYGRLMEIAKANNGQIPEDVLQEVIHKLQSSVNENTWGNPDAKAAQDAMKNLSGRLNDILKRTNTEYAEAMKPAAELTGLKSDLVDKFKMDVGTGGKISATETTNTKMGNILNENKTESQDMLERLKEITGVDFLELAKKAKTAEAFNAEGSSQGLNVIAHAGGYGLGALSNIPGGRLIGSLLGGVVGHNINGGQVAKKILDAYISGSESFAKSGTKAALQKYGPLLVNAAKQGGNKLAATHFVLGTSDPEYQNLANELESQ